jgi:hypothetical protein
MISNPNTSNVSSSETQYHNLNDKWVLYHHLPSNKNWTLSGYEIIFNHIDTMEKIIAINETIPEDVIKFSMWFLMREGVTPIWEDPLNESGGNFSYKVINKNVYEVWKQMVYLLCGGYLCADPKYNKYINGITISPKKNFCIIKIWLNTSMYQDPAIITPIMNLTKNGSVFKKHGNDN